MKLLATLLAVLLVACSGRHRAAGAEGGAADGGAAVEPGTPAKADSGNARSKEAGAQVLDGGTPEQSATADGRAPAVLVPTTEDAGHETDVQIVTDSGVKETTSRDASTSDASDGHMADAQIVTDPIPAELPAYVESLEERGFAAAGCSALVSSVEHCCLTVGGSAFACDRERCSCAGTAFEYSGADSLCIIAPAVPLSWECEP